MPALIEFFQRRGSLALEDTAGKGSAWDVRSLPPVQDDDRANVGELASGIVGAVIAIFLFNALPSGLTGMVLNEEGWQFFPLFANWVPNSCLTSAECGATGDDRNHREARRSHAIR